MSDGRRQVVRRVFMEVADLTGEALEAALAGACGDDSALRGEVEALLRAEAQAGGFMSDPTNDAASDQGSNATIAGPPREQVGQMIGPYKLLEQIGEGGFGVVWAAEQREPVKRRVALKIIKLGMDTKQVIARFEAERQALAMMDHSNIARVLDAGATEAGRPYFVMELVKGVPILDYCDTEKLDTRDRLDLFIKVCHAIQHAHQKGIIHRDIKPTNVLVTLHDGVPIPKVIDFGIAKAFFNDTATTEIYTQHRQMIGTPAYMSPEQAEMSGLDIDTRSDIYSLGVLLYELLTGTTPFANEELMSKGFAEMMRIIREEEPDRPSTRLSTLGETATRTAQQRRADIGRLGLSLRGDLDWIVMKCLDKDRVRRYDTANGLAMDIKRHLDDEPVQAGPPGAGYRLRKFIKRNRGQVIAGGVVAAALILGVFGTSVGMAWAINEKNRADAEASNATLAARAEEEAKLDAQANEQKAKDETERAERELARATEIKRLLKDMLTSIKPEEAKGADITLLRGILDDAAERLANSEIADELIAAELHSVVGEVYHALGLYRQAEEHLPVALESRKRVLGEEHPSTLNATVDLANLYSAQGRYAEAEPLYQQTLEMQKRVLGEEHPSTLSSMNNVATAYSQQGRYAEAEPLYLQMLEIQRRVLGEEHPLTLASLGNLANVYQILDRYDEAEPLHQEVLEISRRVLGEEHPNTLDAMIVLAALYKRQSRLAEAEPLLAQALEIQKRVLGEEHPTTLRGLGHLGNLYSAQGRFAEAEPLIQEALALQKRVLGEEHPETLASMKYLANLRLEQGRDAEAEALFLRTLEKQRRVLGGDHDDTLFSMGVLAILYSKQGRYAEVEQMYRQTLEIQRRRLGDEHRDTLGTMTNLGLLYNSMRRYEDAVEMLSTSLPIKRRVLGVQHPWTRIAMKGLARAYAALGRYAEAEQMYLQVLELQRPSASDEDPDALGTITDLGLLYNVMGRYEDAVEMLETSLPIKRRVLGVEHPWTGIAMQGLAWAYGSLGRTDEAASLHQELFALQLNARLGAADDPDADAQTLNHAAWMLLTHQNPELRDPERALAYARRACDAEEVAGGPNLWSLLDTLALAQHRIGDDAAAVETQRRALELAPEEHRERLEATLTTYEAALAGEVEAAGDDRQPTSNSGTP
jgi:serine/threonine protein kinase/tetratricopeptide (TPR) repeat protein